MKINSKNNISFTGIYKIKGHKTSDANNLIINHLQESDFVFRISKIFNEDGENYLYAITNDNLSAEVIFENDLKKHQIPFWKALSIIELGSKKLLDKIFEADKLIKGKESWII